MNAADPILRMPSHGGGRAASALEKQLSSIYARASLLEAASAEQMTAEVSRHRPIVLYGAGPLAHMTLVHLRRIGIEPAAVADSNQARWGTAFDGYPIISPGDAVGRYAHSARFVVTIYNGSAVRRQLREMGCESVVHFADLYFEHPGECLPYCGLANRNAVLDSWEEVVKASRVWHDQRSVEEYVSQLAWRLRLPESEMPPHDAPAECYFPNGLYEFLSKEIVFDCGAFDGDSLRQYLARRPAGAKSRVLAFEPDADSFVRLKEFVNRLPEAIAAGVRAEPWAVAETSGQVPFSALGSVRSGVADSGGCKVAAVAIDDIGVIPTLIKMDVEGFELSALKGAASVLRRHLPVLAISLYHHASDLWTIPNFLKSLAPDYRLFLRRYAEDCWELVLYAVPASRLIDGGATSAGMT
jgi:FkbM family methyltransferase